MKNSPITNAEANHVGRSRADLLFDAPPLTHPHVLEAYRKITSKLASHLCASDRLRDAADVQALIKAWALPLVFDHPLDRRVRAACRRIWRGDVR